MGQPIAFVTGAGGEMGHLLLPALRNVGYGVVALDLNPLPSDLAATCLETAQASILDGERMAALVAAHPPDVVFHLAALLSRHAEKDPERAHAVNVEGTLGVLRLCRQEALRTGRDVRVLFPSTIAVYGLPGAAAKAATGAVREDEWTTPIGMYGCNKLYCEMVGRYWTDRSRRDGVPGIDFRALRFPGLISAQTVPSGGTTDYASEMIHAAAAGRPYTCFVREDTRLPFMTMPDAVTAFLALAEARAGDLRRKVYNLRAFSPSAGEILAALRATFPSAEVRFAPDPARQALVDSWPADLDDSPARADWGLAPRYGLREAMDEYLIPALGGGRTHRS